MSGIARAVLVGRLTQDPKLSDSERMLLMSIAVNYRTKKDDEWVEEVSFFDVKVLGNRAKGLASFLEKGREIAVDAKIVQERWEDKETGKGRSAVRFIADEVTPLGSSGSKDDDQPSGDEPVAAAASGANDDIPF